MSRSNKMKALMAIFMIGAIITAFFPKTKDAEAAALLQRADVMTTLKASTAANHTIYFKTPTGIDTDTDTITLTFASGWDISALGVEDFDLHTTSGAANTTCLLETYENDIDLVITTATATQWSVAISSQVVTFDPDTGANAYTVPANACIKIEIGTNATTGTGNTQIVNHATPASYTLAIAGGFGDTGDIVTNIVSDDAVAISATVDETLTFSISDNSIGFGTLTTANVRYATGDLAGQTGADPGAHTIIVGTNATTGYTLSVQGATLTSGSDTIDALGSATASSAGSEQFGLNVSTSGGIGAGVAPYATGSSYAYTGTASTAATVGSSSGASANTTYTVNYIANIASNTPAGSYTATLTYTVSAAY